MQQDGQEFMKLFLTLLETACEAIPMLGQKMTSMFKGKSGYQTRCLSCEKLSHSSNRFDDFCELDIPIKGYTSLEESMGALLAPEILEGDNQYFCDHCGCKQDAARQLIVKDLPPVLCISLQRFVFDLQVRYFCCVRLGRQWLYSLLDCTYGVQKMDRVKASDKFSFPTEIDAYMVTNDAQTRGIMYDLEGILLHKGPSARQGHYVAHVAVNRKGSRSSKPVWYRFDDTEVTKLEKGSAGHSDHGWRVKPMQSSSSQGTGSSAKPKGEGEIKEQDTGDIIDLSGDQCGNGIVVEKAQEKELVEDVKEVVSSNAYLLVYKRRSSSSSGRRVVHNTEILEWYVLVVICILYCATVTLWMGTAGWTRRKERCSKNTRNNASVIKKLSKKLVRKLRCDEILLEILWIRPKPYAAQVDLLLPAGCRHGQMQSHGNRYQR